MHDSPTLPLHPSRRHPLTGEPLRALGHRKNGQVIWPILGGDDTVDPNNPSGGDGGDGGDKARDLGFPAETPVAEMEPAQQAAYWRHQARRHEDRNRKILGGRKVEDVQADLAAFAKIQEEQKTPAEQALTARFDEGKAAGRAEALDTAAVAIFTAALADSISDDDAEELVANFNASRYVKDGAVDSSAITAYAKRFSGGESGTDTSATRRRDFGAGNRGGGGGNDKSTGAGAAQAAKRFGTPKTS